MNSDADNGTSLQGPEREPSLFASKVFQGNCKRDLESMLIARKKSDP
jgi:hypothetical protein